MGETNVLDVTEDDINKYVYFGKNYLLYRTLHAGDAACGLFCTML